MAPPPIHDLGVSPCFHGCWAFLHMHFLPGPPPSHPLSLSLRSQQLPSPWDCSTISKLQLPAAVPSRGLASLSEICMAAASCVCFSFHLGCHRPAVSLSTLNVSLLTQTNCPAVVIRPPASFTPLAKGRSSPTNTPVPHPSSFVLLSFA